MMFFKFILELDGSFCLAKLRGYVAMLVKWSQQIGLRETVEIHRYA